MTAQVVLASRNQKKLIELRRVLEPLVPGIEVLGLDDVAPFDEPAETEPTFEGNALIKARACFASTGIPSLADDSGIAVDALNGMPGVLSARWSGAGDQANNRLLLTQLADVIENDQALATKILRTVNSSYYGLRKRCTNIRQAINFLGLNAVKSLALSFSLVETIDDPNDVTFDYVDYWRRGVYSAVAARFIAQTANLTCPDEAFFGALMNMSFLMAGTVSTNPVLFFLGILMILAWKNAGYLGVDRYLLPALGTPWKQPELATAPVGVAAQASHS